MTGEARLCSTCVNDELTFGTFPATSPNVDPPITDSAGEPGLTGDDGELQLLSLMLPLRLSRLHITVNNIGIVRILLKYHCLSYKDAKMQTALTKKRLASFLWFAAFIWHLDLG